jgi:hypothetical protein
LFSGALDTASDDDQSSMGLNYSIASGIENGKGRRQTGSAGRMNDFAV